MAAYTSAGSTLRISASQPATYDAAGYSSVVGSLVGEVTDMGEFGRENNLVTHNPLANRATQKFKGSFNLGQLTIQLALDTDDTGQILCKTASTSDANYTIIIQTQNGDRYYTQAKVMSWKVGVGSVDQITTATMVIELTTTSTGAGFVEVLAA